MRTSRRFVACSTNAEVILVAERLGTQFARRRTPKGAVARMCERAQARFIILDEFQRFRELLRGDGDAGELARALFELWRRGDRCQDAPAIGHPPTRC